MSDFSIGEKLRITLLGQSHGPAVGCVIEGFPAGQKIDLQKVQSFMVRRAPGQNAWSTPRREADLPEFVSGLVGWKTCGVPLTALIRNTDTRSADYAAHDAAPERAAAPAPAAVVVVMVAIVGMMRNMHPASRPAKTMRTMASKAGPSVRTGKRTCGNCRYRQRYD